jgi:uncharacterized protein YpmB
MKITRLKSIVMILITSIISSLAVAQKLPGSQKTSLRAPANIKVDGKATEWKGGMQAYNRAIQAQYTVANDDKRLYLIVRADKREIINKIINGGVSFSISKIDSKKTDSVISITYPVFGRQNRPMINFTQLSEALADAKSTIKRDSVMLGSNESLEEKAKFIRVSGVNNVDTLLSIYNIDGVKAKSAFDDKLVYTVEIGIDLKLFHIAESELKDFNYNIRLNAIIYDDIPGITMERDESGKVTAMNIWSPETARVYVGATSSTDCSGKYKLAEHY